MLMVSKSGEGFKITNDSDGQSMFVVVRNTNSNRSNLDYQVAAGDIVKLGRVKFLMKSVCIHSQDEASD